MTRNVSTKPYILYHTGRGKSIILKTFRVSFGLVMEVLSYRREKEREGREMKKYTLPDREYDLEDIFSEEATEDRLQLLEDRHIIKYRTKTIKSGNILECEIYPVWNTSAQTSRARKAKESRPAQKRLNERNATKNVIRLINANFTDADIWGTFTYETKKLPATVELAQKEMSKFIRRLKYYAEKHNYPPLKYVYVTEFEDDASKGKKRVHHHIVLNFPDRDVAERLWRNGARTQTRRLQADESGYEGLARYITKDPRGTKRYICSKNLKKPQITVSDCKISRKRVKKIISGDTPAKIAFEEMYKNAYTLTSFFFKTSDIVSGAYIYAKLRLKTGRKTE